MRRAASVTPTVLLPVVLVGACTALSLAFDADAAGAALVMVVAVLGSAFRGRGAGLLASFLAALSLSYFFIPPKRDFSLGKGDDAIALVTFVVVALVVSTLFVETKLARRQAEDAARREAEAVVAAETNRSRAAFFAAAGHNLRTPLTTMKAAIGSLRDFGDSMPEADRKELLRAVADETERLERLTTKILEVARIRAGGLTAEPEEVDLAGLGQAAIGRVAPMRADVSWHLDVRGTPPPMDLTMTEQILLNLLENAARYAPAGTEVSMEARPDGDSYRIAVVDHGPGVPEAEREAIFAEFRSDRSDGAGSGLGLAIVRALVEAQGGTVRCDGTPGGGATFVVTLPYGARLT